MFQFFVVFFVLFSFIVIIIVPFEDDVLHLYRSTYTLRRRKHSTQSGDRSIDMMIALHMMANDTMERKEKKKKISFVVGDCQVYSVVIQERRSKSALEKFFNRNLYTRSIFIIIII